MGTTHLAGQTCTVDFSMTPTHPGMRYGAISFTASGGAVLANSYVYGVGTGPQVIWNPGSQTALGGGFVFASGTAVDGSGNVYVSDTGGNAVVEIPAGGGPSRLLATLTAPDDVVVDGG